MGRIAAEMQAHTRLHGGRILRRTTEEEWQRRLACLNATDVREALAPTPPVSGSFALTFESLQALRREPSAFQTAIRIANDLSVGEIASSPVARNTLILLRWARAASVHGNWQPVEGCGGPDVPAH
jgi:hypothetical protein